VKSVAVIGAGFAGLSAALELARRGIRVTVVDALASPGGRAQRLEFEGYRFDAGPTLLVMTDVLRSTLGDDAFARLELRRLSPGYRVFWPDGERFDMSSNLAEFLDQTSRFEGALNNARAVRYLACVHDLYVRSRANILDVDHTVPSFIRTLLAPGRFSPWAAGGLRAFVRRSFSSSRVVDALTFQPLYLGTSPRRAPALYSMLAVEEVVGGIWYCPGGTAAVVDALVCQCEAAGVTFSLGRVVDEIRVAGKRARTVVCSDAAIDVDGVVVTADRETTLSTLFSPHGAVRSPRYGHSAMVWYVGVRKRLAIPHHSVMLPADPWGEYERLDNGGIPDEPLIYACNAAVDDAAVAPPGHTALLLLAPVPNARALPKFDETALFDKVVSRVERHAGPFRSEIALTRARGPREFRSDLRLTHGAAFGPDHMLDQMGAFRPPIRHARYANVVFAGSGTHPGSGVPMVMLSGRMAARRLAGALT
jgi:phytoene desaturase